MAKAKLIGMPWDFSELMNEAISCLPQRPMQQRSHIWASELGGDYASRYLKMWAHPMTNPPNDRSRRKFISGDIFEWIVYLVLGLTGVLKQRQLHGEVQLPGLLKVTGRLDFCAGGDVDWDKAKFEAEKIKSLFAAVIAEMPPIVFHSIDRVLWRMQQMFSRVPLKEVIIECKSVSGFIYDIIEKNNKPRPKHPFQTLHYVIGNKIPGELLYVSRDSFELKQFEITATKDMLKEYKADVAGMTGWYNASGKNYLKNIPPKDPEVDFYEERWQFAKNNNVEYSPYLTMLYGYKDFDEFSEKWKKTLSRWNRAFKRHVQVASGAETPNGKPMKLTDKNKEDADEVRKAFPLFDKYVVLAKKEGAFQKQEEGEDE